MPHSARATPPSSPSAGGIAPATQPPVMLAKSPAEALARPGSDAIAREVGGAVAEDVEAVTAPAARPTGALLEAPARLRRH
jgi:hypothetical protein